MPLFIQSTAHCWNISGFVSDVWQTSWGYFSIDFDGIQYGVDGHDSRKERERERQAEDWA